MKLENICQYLEKRLTRWYDGKEIADMTLEELWMLFPIVLSDVKEEWCDWYAEKRNQNDMCKTDYRHFARSTFEYFDGWHQG